MDRSLGMPAPFASEIAEVRRAFIAALHRGDPTGAAAFYTDDARLLAPSAEVLTGRAAIARFCGRYLLVHRREADGSWRRAVETFNPDGDPPTQPRA
jgi:ketosteroid isomerase-like protein